MSILAVPDHFYYSSLKSLQSASKLPGNEIPVLKALLQIEGHQTHWQGAICPELSSPPHPQLESFLVCFCCYQTTSPRALFTFPFQRVSAVGVSPISSSMCLSHCLQGGEITDAMPQVHAPSQTESLNFGHFSCLVFLLHIISSSSTLPNNRVSWFHSQTFCFQETELQKDQVPSPTPPNTAPGSVKREMLCRMRPHCTIHSNSTWNWAFCSSVNTLRCINAGESSETGPQNNPGLENKH